MPEADYRYVIPNIPPSNNKFIGREVRYQYQAAKKEWARLVMLFCTPKPTRPIDKSIVKLTYFFKDRRRRDPDNYSGKMLLDGLVRAGVITDDSFDNIHLIISGNYDKENPRTVIEIKELTP